MDASQSRVHDHPSGVRCSPGCSARTAENSDPFLAAAMHSREHLAHPVEIREPEPEPELPLLTVRVREDIDKPLREQKVAEVLLDGRPMGQLPFTSAHYQCDPGRFGKLTLELFANRAEVTADG